MARIQAMVGERLIVGIGAGLTYWMSPSGYYLVAPALLWAAATLSRRIDALLTVAAGVHRRDPRMAGDGRATLWALTAGLLVAAAVRWRGLLDLVTLRREHRQPSDLLLASLLLTVAAYTASKYAWFTTEPRYLFTAYPVLVLALVRLIPDRDRAPVALRTTVAVAVLLFVAAPSLTLLVSRADDVPGDPANDLPDVVDVLDAEGRTHVYEGGGSSPSPADGDPGSEEIEFCEANGHIAEDGTAYQRDPEQGCAWVDDQGNTVPVDDQGNPIVP